MSRALHVLFAAIAVAAVSGCQSIRNYREDRKTYELTRCIYRFNMDVAVNDVHVVHRAVLTAVKDLELKAVTDQVDKLTGQVTAHFADDVQLRVTVQKRTREGCRLTITCGLPGDRTRAEQVYKEIAKHLPTELPAAADTL